MDKRMQNQQRAFLRSVTVVSLMAAAILVSVIAGLWLGRDNLYVRQAEGQARQGDHAQAVLTAEKIGDEALRLQCRENIAAIFYENRDFSLAEELYGSLDQEENALKCAYAQADSLYHSGDYGAALDAFAALGGYADSRERQKQAIYALADQDYAAGDYSAAVMGYLSIQDYGDSREKALEAAFALTGDREVARTMVESGGQTPESLEKTLAIARRRACVPGAAIAAGAYHTVLLRPDGTVEAWGDNRFGQCDVASWEGIVQIALGAWHTVGLKADGTVVAVGKNDWGQCDTAGLSGIVKIAAGDGDTLALSRTGQVTVLGSHSFEAIARAVEVTDIFAGSYGAAAVTASGTVIPSHPSFALKPQGQILSLSLGTGYLLTQYLDGSVTCTTELGDRWTDMVCCDAGARGILGVTLEGRVKARFFRQGDALDLSGLSGIVQCAMGAEHCAFLTEEGQLIVLGDNSFGQCDGNGRKVDF